MNRTPEDREAGPLAGLTVLDLTLALAGPFATFLLAGLGARVIKIENPASPDHCRENAPFIGRNGVSLGRSAPDDVSVAALNRLRGKYAVTLNLKQPGSREVFADLVRRADVVVENFTPGTLDRLGVGYEVARAQNPRIVYCSISGYGADQATTGSGKAMDSIVQALSGLMMTSGEPAEPPVRVGVPFADLCAPVFAVVGILAALRQRDVTGLGRHVDVSMLGCWDRSSQRSLRPAETCGYRSAGRGAAADTSASRVGRRLSRDLRRRISSRAACCTSAA
jgi:crotonobetainyl-CoA:carnitine CoA-transferase CaiB-like acyl-CoA transferase